MVQQYQSPVRVYKYPFELVMAAYLRRFPSCPQIPVVVTCDITSETTSADGSQTVTERRCKLNVEAPYLLKKIIGVDYVYFIQKNILCRRSRTLHIEAHNESFSHRVIVIEKCRYFVHPENPDWTCFEQSASLNIHSFFGFENSMEKLAMKQYSQNITKGKEIIEYFVSDLKKEGLTYVEPWTEISNSNEPGNADSNQSNRNDTESVKDISIGSSKHKTMSPGQCQYQLETDYIQRYLGELNLMQESSLIQLRKSIADLQKGKVPPDSTLLRFLRARDFNVEKARELLSQSLIWRKKHQVDRLLSEYQMPQVIKDYFPGFWHHQDKDGRPLYLLQLGQMDVKGLQKTIGEEGLLQLTLHVCEEGLRLMEEATRTQGKPISTWTLLVDLEGLNMRHLWRPGIRTLLKIIEMVEANYPETMGRVLVIRAPRVFPILWTLVSTFIDENTRTKFLFSGGNDYLDAGGLTDFISKENIPDFLGGPCKTQFGSERGLVPKSLYTMEKEECPLTEDNLYHSVSLSKGQVHEVLINNDDPGSVITWDFDVLRQDVSFTVFRTRSPVLAPMPPGALQTLNPLAPDPEHRSAIEKSWKENVDYFRVEKSILCHDGESIQGSHVTSHVGTYILQWKFHLSHQLDLLDSLTSHKAKIMYYYEKLRSADYKGSMSSLQSGQSGFSGLSKTSKASLASSCPSR